MKLTVKELADLIEQRYGDPANFVSNVKVWLAEGGITQTALAEEIGMDSSNLNRWLNGHVVPSLKNMLIIDEGLERLLADKTPS
jgi:transcriptional regulator with XRE-family HTH domain